MSRTIAPPKLPPLPKRRGSSGEHHIVVGYREKLKSITDGVMAELEEISSTLDAKNAEAEDPIVEEALELLADDDVEVVSGFPPPKEPE